MGGNLARRRLAVTLLATLMLIPAGATAPAFVLANEPDDSPAVESVPPAEPTAEPTAEPEPPAAEPPALEPEAEPAAPIELVLEDADDLAGR
jgi:hypothetical protein